MSDKNKDYLIGYAEGQRDSWQIKEEKAVKENEELRAKVAELEAIKAEQDYIIKQCETWESGENGCPKCENPNFPCWAEKDFYPTEDEPSFKPEFCEDEDGCWVDYYRWKYRQKQERER